MMDEKDIPQAGLHASRDKKTGKFRYTSLYKRAIYLEIIELLQDEVNSAVLPNPQILVA